jgi:hypothetical protein
MTLDPEAKKKSNTTIYNTFMLFVMGLALITITTHGTSTYDDIMNKVGVGLLVGSITYLASRIETINKETWFCIKLALWIIQAIGVLFLLVVAHKWGTLHTWVTALSVAYIVYLCTLTLISIVRKLKL